jgi:hypothetical protein
MHGHVPVLRSARRVSQTAAQRRVLILTSAIVLVLPALALAAQAAEVPPAADVPPAAAAIRAEALRANHDPAGRPLPLAAHWHRMTCPPDWQIEMIRQGRHLLPWLSTPMPEQAGDKARATSEDALKQLREWRMPFALVTGGQWEATLYDATKRWRGLPPEQSPLTWLVEPVGEKQTGKQLSPFGAVAPWQEVGRYWTDSPGLRKIEEAYPDPPLVLLISNNEAGDLRWHQAETDKHYLQKYGAGRDDEFKRRVVGDGWIERYTALFKGMREGLANDAWKKNTLLVAYSAFGPSHMGRPDMGAEGGWKKYSTTTQDRMAWDWYAWQGAIPSYYDNHWQPNKAVFNVWSCQVEMMNLVFMKEEAWRVNPNYWFELIFWDGNLPDKDNDRYKTYAAAGFPSTPERYRGWVQYGLWLLVPRVAREWRSSADKRDRWWEYFKVIIESVDRVHADPVLTRFWRQGDLVPNRGHPHPFSADIPEKWKNVDRWFHLDSSTDPPRPWELTTRMPVFTLARVIGAKPQREWLLYAHAPMGDKKGVQVTIPDYGPVTVDVALAGSFYRVKEADKSVTAVGK